MAERPRAASFDFDGVLFPRIPIQQQALFRWAFTPWNYNKPLSIGQPVTKEHRAMRDDPLPFKQAFELDLHRRRYVKPAIRLSLESLDSDIMVGNTGRSNNKPWVEMTEELLEKGGVYDLLGHVYYKPKGVSSDESKYWALKELEELGYEFTHYDDNSYTVKRLAPHFPNGNFVIVQDLTTGILFSAREMMKYPNVKRMAMTKEGFLLPASPTASSTSAAR